MRVLLGSGGFTTPERQAAWKAELDSFLGPVRRVLFVPFALADHDAYVEAIRQRGFHAGRELAGIHREPDAARAVREAEAIYVGGGNTFRLLASLYQRELIDGIRERVRAGNLLYVGVSAGTNVACPTIRTTNDMPIVQPPSLDALGLVTFQINPHYFPGPIYMKSGESFVVYGGETRDDRLREFHEENETPVLAIEEGGFLRLEGKSARLGGTAGARWLRRGQGPIARAPGDEIGDLLRG